MGAKDKTGHTLISFSGDWISWIHTVAAYTAFLGALVVGCSLHFHKIVQNEHYGYPDEWFPSVSATIGDRYPERSFFMLFIAITSGFRFALVGLWYLLTRKPGQSLPKLVAAMGLFRSLTCGGWTYVTSTDDHDWHDIFMISYLVATIPWTFGCLALSPNNGTAVRYRTFFAASFFGTLVPLVYFFIQHKVHKIAGAYTTYAFFEWALILFDVGFDAVTALDFKGLELSVVDVGGSSTGQNGSVMKVVPGKEKENVAMPVSTPDTPTQELLDVVADVYNGYVFWSMLTSLGVVIWYFPLWYMGISGYEAAVMVTISPMLLARSDVRTFVLRNLRLCHLMSLTGLLGYLVTIPEIRLLGVSLGVSMSCLTWAATFYSERHRPHRLQAKVVAWTIGLVMSTVVKFAWQTNSPIWPTSHAANGGHNGTGIVLAVLAILQSTRRTINDTHVESSPRYQPGRSSLLSAAGFGGLLFALHSLLSDSSTMISWVWEGFPIRGPIAVPYGAATIASMGLGLIVGSRHPRLAQSWITYVLGCSGAAILTTSMHWKGYAGGLVLAFYLTAVSIPIIATAARRSPAMTFGVGFLIYNFMVLFHVWVVAYAFVPGGPLVREHTDWVMMTTMFLIGCGVLSTPSSDAHKQNDHPLSSPGSRLRQSYHLYIVAALQLAALSVAYLRFPSYDYKPYHEEDKVLTAGIWTVHFGLDNDMWSSEYRMRDVIKELEIDVMGLLETDQQRIIMGNRDSTQFLAEDLGMYVDYGPGPNKHTWGCALLSKFPIMNSTHHLLPSPVGELAPAIHATLDVYGELVDVFVFHSGQEEDPEDRRLQSQYLASLMGSVARPAILLSYLVTNPLEGNYKTYVSELSGMHDIDPDDWDRWCEYILYKGLTRIGYARVSRGTITDTEIQVGKFVLGKEPAIGVDRDRKIKEKDVIPGARFPTLFKGEGVRGHQYHVFDEPKYFGRS